MPILDLQKRSRELGRIRIGQIVQTANGKTRPAKLDRFRLTCASEPVLAKVADLYGGTVTPWTPANGGPGQYEVITTTTRLPVLVPPQPVTQYYELWSGGGCQRRCDGVTELLSDRSCLCGPDPLDRQCKPTTRLNVILRDIPGIGVWRIETHGYYAAVELPDVAEFLAQTKGYVRAWLALEERVIKRIINGKPETRRFQVPVLEVDITPAALLAGEGVITPNSIETTHTDAVAAASRPALETGQPTGEPPVIAGEVLPAAPSPDELLEQARAATSKEAFAAVWAVAGERYPQDEELRGRLQEIGAQWAVTR